MRNLADALSADAGTDWRERQDGTPAASGSYPEDVWEVFDHAPIGMHWVDAAGVIVWANQTELDLLGYPREDYIGQPIANFHADADVIADILARLGRGETLRSYEARLRCRDGSIRHVVIDSNVRWQDGRFLHTRCFTREVRNRQSTERALARSARQSEALYLFVDRLHRTRFLGEIYDAALHAILNALLCNRASILLYDATGVMRFVGWSGLSEGYRRAVEGHSPWSPDAVNPTPICMEDIAQTDIPAPLKATVMDEGIHALAFIPLVSNGRLIGKFMAYFDAPHVFTPDEIDVSISIARQLVFGIERARSEEALREREQRFREMIDALPAAVYTTDADGVITHFNPAAVEFAGRTPRLGDRWCVSWKLYAPDGSPLPHDACPMAITLKEGRPVRGAEAIAERPDGTRRWFTPYPTPLRDANGAVVGGINMLVDITERKAAEQAMAHLAAIVSSSSDAIVSTTLDGIVTSWNTSAERMFGYAAAEMVGQSIERLIPPAQHADEARVLARLRTGESIAHYETTRLMKDGRRLEVALSRSPIRDRAGTIIGASSILRDITERKRADDLARQHARQLQLIADNAPVYIAYCDDQRRFKFVNNSYAARFGLQPKDIVGKTIPAVLGEPAYATFRQYVDVVLSGQAVEFDVEVPYAHGTRFMHCSYAPETDADGRVVGWVSAVIDITDRRDVEQALRASEEKLREADHRKDEFLAMLAHELRNPLAPILTAAHMLRADDPTRAVHGQARDIIERQTRRLARLVDDLLDVSRITSGRIRLQCEPVAVADVVARAVETIRPLVEQFGHTLNVTVVPDALWINADAARMEQVLVNLLNNAAKYTDRGGQIDLNVAADDSAVTLYVRDTGIGIEPGLLPHVFELFTQAERTIERSRGGLGIGLSLARQLVLMHDGTIEVKSEVGRGSEFRIRIPRIPAPAHALAADHAPAETTAPRLRVLVVDDNIDAAQSMAFLLEAGGHDVRMAHDGEEAVEVAVQHRPHAVLLDLGLPLLDGCAVAARIRATPAIAGAMLIALTGYGQDADRRRTQEAGFNHHLIKPVDIAAVQTILQAVAERSPA